MGDACIFTGVFTGITVLGWPFSVSNAVGTVPVQNVDWSNFLTVLLWSRGNWEGASVCAGKVENISRVFLISIAIVFWVVLANHILPTVAFSGPDGGYSAYENGLYIQVARDVCGSCFGHALGFVQTISVAGLFAQCILENTYMIFDFAEWLNRACFRLYWGRGLLCLPCAANMTNFVCARGIETCLSVAPAAAPEVSDASECNTEIVGRTRDDMQARSQTVLCSAAPRFAHAISHVRACAPGSTAVQTWREADHLGLTLLQFATKLISKKK